MGVRIVNKITSFVMRLLLVGVIFLVMAILCKGNSKYKEYIYYSIYEDNLSFSFFKNIYNKYLGGVFPEYRLDKLENVFNEDIRYTYKKDYFDGVMLGVSDKYLVPVLDGGIVVYIGNKDNYGNVVMIEGSDGVDTWYGNICNSSYNLYDTVSADSFVGEACGDYIYLVFSKKNEYLNYEDYFEG